MDAPQLVRIVRAATPKPNRRARKHSAKRKEERAWKKDYNL